MTHPPGSLVALIDERWDAVLERWLEAAHRELPVDLDREGLQGPLPAVLGELVAGLRRPTGTPPPQPPASASASHGLRRVTQGYSPAATAGEILLLQQVLLQEAERSGVSLGTDEVLGLARCIGDLVHQALTAAASTGALASGSPAHLTPGTRRASSPPAVTAAELERRRLRALFDHAPALVCALEGPEHVFVLVNPLYQRIAGSGRALVGRRMAEALPEVVEQGLIEVLDHVHRTGKAFTAHELPLRLERTPGATPVVASFTFTAEPRLNDQGQLEGVDIFGFEVTEEVQARGRAEAAVAELEAIFHGIPDAVYAGNRMGIWRANAPALAELGYASVEALNLHFLKLSSRDPRPVGAGELHPVHGAAFQRALEGHEEVQHLRIRHAATGEERVVRAASAPIRVGEQVVGAVSIHTDLTERVNAEAAKERLLEELLQRTEFEQHLVGIVSHDLRNPVQAILLGATSLLRGELQDERVRGHVQRIRTSAERMSRLIRDLLDFTQARLGGQPSLKPRRVALHELARQGVEEVQHAHPDRRLVIFTRGDTTGNWDADRITQVVVNLVTNAVKYGSAGTPVTVTTIGAEGEVMLEVHNLGTPIRAELQARLFEPLRRGSLEVDPAGRSVGLGLYIAQQLVLAHRGSIEVRSSPEEGTTFTVRLPRGD